MSSPDKVGTPKYAAESRVGVLGATLITVLFLIVSKNLPITLFADFLFFVLPYVVWLVATKLVAEMFLRYFLIKRAHELFLPRPLHERFLPRNYFRASVSYSDHLWWRALQLLFFVFFLSSLTVPRLPNITPLNPTVEVTQFVFIGLLFLSVLGPVLGLGWLYEDWGLRGFDETRSIVYPIGSTLIRYVVGFGALGTFARFALSLGVNGIEVAAAITTILLLFVPSCFIVTAAFHKLREPKFLANLSSGKIAHLIPLKSLKVE